MGAVWVFIGGGAGALLRYFSGSLIGALVSARFPAPTLFVNCAGSLVIGFVTRFFDVCTPDIKMKLFLVTGFLGAYTTFSAYSLETARLFINGSIKQALLNMALNNFLCIAFVCIGLWMHKLLLKQ
jgi:CrcB protein